jgi:hypothetical protein
LFYFCPLLLGYLNSLFKKFIVVQGKGILWHLQRFLQYINYIILEFTPPPISFIPSPPIGKIVSRGIFFPFTFRGTHYLHILFLKCFPTNLSIGVLPNYFEDKMRKYKLDDCCKFEDVKHRYTHIHINIYVCLKCWKTQVFYIKWSCKLSCVIFITIFLLWK